MPTLEIVEKSKEVPTLEAIEPKDTIFLALEDGVIGTCEDLARTKTTMGFKECELYVLE